MVPALFQAANAFEGPSSRKEVIGRWIIIDGAHLWQAEPGTGVWQHQEPVSLGSVSSGAAGGTCQMKGSFRQSSPERANRHPLCSEPRGMP